MPRPLDSEVVARVEGGLRYSSGESKRKWGALGQRLGAWWLEALGVLVWALSLKRTIQAWDRPYDPKLLTLMDVPSWFDAAQRPALLARARLREAATLEDADERAEAWHWRANTGSGVLPVAKRRIVADALCARVADGGGDRVGPGGDGHVRSQREFELG